MKEETAPSGHQKAFAFSFSFLRPPLLLLMMLAGALPAFGASLRFVPMSIVLDSQSRKGSLTVENAGDEKVTVQLQVVTWSQDGQGNEVYEPTKDLVFFPQIVTIEAGKRGIVRVGYESAQQVDIEKSYRVFVQEIPVRTPGESVIKTLIRVSLPIFIVPKTQRQALAVESTGIVDGRLQTRIRNSGTTHAMVKTIRATGVDGSGKEVFSKDFGGWYVLPGVSRVFPIDVTHEECALATLIRIVATAGDVSASGQIRVDAAFCAQLAGSRNKENADPERPPAERP
jgi:fimbrial chaperone protein